MLVALAAQPAAATVTLEPAQGVQGDAAEIAFKVTEDRAPAAYTKQIDIVMPDADPVAEVYPLSTNDWGPKIAYRDVATALPGVHGAKSNSGHRVKGVPNPPVERTHSGLRPLRPAHLER